MSDSTSAEHDKAVAERLDRLANFYKRMAYSKSIQRGASTNAAAMRPTVAHVIRDLVNDWSLC